jgi:hypothetical protein
MTLAELAIDIGGLPVLVRTDNLAFLQVLENRYAGFVNASAPSVFTLDAEVIPQRQGSNEDEELSLRFAAGRWVMERGDFYAECDLASSRGMIRQSANPYSIDAALRIVHSLLLAQHGGLLVHAASVVRGGRAFVFAGVSGAGKTTLARLAPADATLLTDEISYVRREAVEYLAYGTPFTGELGMAGKNVYAPLAALYLLAQGPENKIEPVREADAVRALLESVLFFADDPELVARVFDSACELVERVPVRRLTFVPDYRVWELIV